jgi:archaemetzincin
MTNVSSTASHRLFGAAFATSEIVRLLLAFAMAVLPSGGRSLATEAGATIALAPIGDVDRSTLEALAPIVADRFGARVQIVEAVPLPPVAWDAGRRQWRAAALDDALARALRSGWERLVGVTDVDLYTPGLNFVFGEAQPSRGVAVFSLARLHDPERARFVHRAETEVVHELGHTYGLGHCSNPHCVMWFSNTLAESDHKGSRFCAAHAAELQRALAAIRRKE